MELENPNAKGQGFLMALNESVAESDAIEKKLYEGLRVALEDSVSGIGSYIQVLSSPSSSSSPRTDQKVTIAFSVNSFKIPFSKEAVVKALKAIGRFLRNYGADFYEIYDKLPEDKKEEREAPALTPLAVKKLEPPLILKILKGRFTVPPEALLALLAGIVLGFGISIFYHFIPRSSAVAVFSEGEPSAEIIHFIAHNMKCAGFFFDLDVHQSREINNIITVFAVDDSMCEDLCTIISAVSSGPFVFGVATSQMFHLCFRGQAPYVVGGEILDDHVVPVHFGSVDAGDHRRGSFFVLGLKFVVLASSVLRDLLTDEEVCDIVSLSLKSPDTASRIARAALSNNQVNELHVVVIHFG